MTMLTRCTACETAFRITADQLVLRQGKVRCGECGTVFSALEQLARGDDPDRATPVTPESAIGLPPLSASIPAADLTTAEVVLNGPARAESTAPPPSEAPTAVDDASTILPPTETRAVAQSGKRRWGSVAGSLLAGAALVLQSAYFYRDEAAARFPAAKPWLERMCVHLSCGFDVPRDVQAISIESHDLQADPANKALLALIALLRNRAGFPQNPPHLELTLTDAQDAPIARRVLAPREYGTAAQMGAGAELQVRVLIDASQVKASGYRLYAFYP